MRETSSNEIKLLAVSPPEGDVWELFLRGERDALAKIYRNNLDSLYNYGMHLCFDSERVKDCIQDLFRDLWQDRQHLAATVHNLRYYLLSSLRRRLLRSLQKDRRNLSRLSSRQFDFDIVPPHESMLIADEMSNERKARLKRGIAVLTRRQREVVYLRFYQNLSYNEIAELMAMKTESVYNLISKAIGALKDAVVVICFAFCLNPVFLAGNILFG